MRVKIIIIFTFSFWATWALAQSTNEALEQCAHIKSNDARLLCFDNLAESIANNQKNKPALTKNSQPITTANLPLAQQLTPESIRPEKTPPTTIANKKHPNNLEANFGREHIKSKAVQHFKQVEFIVKSAKLSLRKKWRLTFENGQVWHASEVEKGLKFKAGDSVIIKRGVFNAFYIKKKGSKRSVRVKRIK